MSDGSLVLGRREGGGEIALDPRALLRHVMALGSSGSGKTVFCKVVVEEAVRRGIPAICVDPQGDLCSLAAGVLEPAELEARGVDPAIARELSEGAEVVIFTPGSARGLPLCADPVDASLASTSPAERVHAVTRTAAIVVGLLGYDLDADDGAGLAAVLDRALHELIDAGRAPSLAALADHLAREEPTDFASYARYLDARRIRVACQRLARLDVRRAADALPRGRADRRGRAARSRSPRAGGEGQDARRDRLPEQPAPAGGQGVLRRRARRAPPLRVDAVQREPRAAGALLPRRGRALRAPVRKPACKEGLSLLFKQARKYGVCCLMATQNPGDVDYKAMAQFATWALGRLTTRQDLKKIEPTVKSLAPVESDDVLGRLPSLEPGQLVLLAPDQLDAPAAMRVRWLATRHETWTEERIEAAMDPLRARFAALVSEAVPGDLPADAPDPPRAAPDAPRNAKDGGLPPAAPEAPRAALEDAALAAPAPRERSAPDEAALAALAERPSASAKELAQAIGKSEATARRALERLVERGEARSFKAGRSVRWFAAARGGRPDLGLPPAVRVLVAHVGAEEAARIAAAHARTRLLGVIGEDERFASAQPLHRLVYKLDFEEKVERSMPRGSSAARRTSGSGASTSTRTTSACSSSRTRRASASTICRGERPARSATSTASRR
ncbi:MAG: DUF853 family protein [Sandaracinaceae bacterium]|nr:DUF853 family protein [Sandaracinaceae bacterium]